MNLEKKNQLLETYERLLEHKKKQLRELGYYEDKDDERKNIQVCLQNILKYLDSLDKNNEMVKEEREKILSLLK